MNIPSASYDSSSFNVQVSTKSTNQVLATHKKEEARVPDSKRDTVSISSSENRNPVAGVEQYRLPGWLSGYIHDVYKYDDAAVKETGVQIKMYEEFSSDGAISTQEQRALDAYAQNMTANEDRREADRYQVENKDLLDEYGQMVRDSYEEAMREYGVQSHQDYLDKVIGVDGDNTSIHATFRQRLFSNPRAAELMDILGIKAQR